MNLEKEEIFRTIQLSEITDIFYFWDQVKVEYYQPKETYLLFWKDYLVFEIENISLIPDSIVSDKQIYNRIFLSLIRDFFIKIGNPNITQPISKWNLNQSLNIKLTQINKISEFFNSYKYGFSNKVYLKNHEGDILPNWYINIINKKFKNYNNFNPNSWILVITPGACPKYIITPLIDACFKGNLEMVKRLLKLNANPNICCSDGWSPIMEAAFAGNEDEQTYLDIVALLILYKANPWPGGQFISCRDGSIMTKLEDVPPVNCSKLRLFCLLVTIGVPIKSDPLTKKIFYQLPQEFENFKKESLEIAKSIYVPFKPNSFRVLPSEITKNILEITFGYNIHLIIKKMISPGILDTIL